jgi:hypothetical protein
MFVCIIAAEVLQLVTDNIQLFEKLNFIATHPQYKESALFYASLCLTYLDTTGI